MLHSCQVKNVLSNFLNMQQNKQICKYKARAITYEGKRIKTYGNNEYFYN